MANEAQPRLAVILHADVVGSTTMVRKDERLAHQRIQAAFRDVGSFVERYGGTVNEIRGDALVAEFARASDAVLAALAAQEANRESAEALDNGIVPVLRMGIALGEVVIADATVTGAGVVLAQRLEQLAEPGRICVSAAVREATPDRLALRFESLGVRELKGFDEPVSAYTLALPFGAPVPPPQPAERARPRAGKRRLLAGAVVALALLAAGLAAWLEPWKPTPASSEQPSIAVLAFSNMSNDPEQGYFAEGIAEDIITDLSKIPDLLVIARNSSFSYKGKNVPIKTVARELGVQYVLEGSVRRAGDTLRINAQLIHAGSDGHLWAERYDGSLADVFAIQDKVTQKIVAALAVQLSTAEGAVLKARGTANPEAYDAFLLGVRANNATGEVDFDSNNEAVNHFGRAIELDPEYALAYAGLAAAKWLRFSIVTRSDFSARDKAFELANKSLALGENALAHRVLAKQYLAPRAWEVWGGSRESIDFDSAIAELRKALSLEPNSADTMAELAFALVLKGEPREAVTQMDKAKRLNPDFPDWYYLPAGIAYYLSEQYDRAVREFDALYASQEWSTKSAYWLSAAYAQAGNEPKAREIADATKANMIGPQYVQQVSDGYPFKKDEHIEMLHEGLRKAGVPDFRNR